MNEHEERDPFYTDDEKRIFRYWAGPTTGPIAADPYELLRDMTIALQGSINGVLGEWRCEDEVASAIAEKRLVAAARTAFGMDPFDRTDPQGGGGATSTEVLKTLLEFLQFLGQKKSGVPATVTPATGSPASSPGLVVSPTDSGSAFG